MIKLFFSYSHKDEIWRIELEKHLSILKRMHVIDAWNDRQIDAGSVIDDEIDKNLKDADIILLMVSSDFLASDYCYEKEMQEAMLMHEAHKAVVIPVIVRPCDWHGAPFGKLLATPRDGKAITTCSNPDEAFLDIIQSIKRVTATLQRKDTDSHQQPSHPTINQMVGSKNIHVPRNYTDFEVDAFIDDAFDYMQQYFQESMHAVQQQNPHVQTRFSAIDAHKFSAEAYANGSSRARCMIFKGGLGGRSKAISFSYEITGNTNSLNESLTPFLDGTGIWLKPLGMAMILSPNKQLDKEAAAEYYWSLFIKRLQQR